MVATKPRRYRIGSLLEVTGTGTARLFPMASGQAVFPGSGLGSWLVARMRSAARSAIMTVGAWVWPRMRRGITEASTTRNPSRPRTRSSQSTTAPSSLPMRQVPAAWYADWACSRTYRVSVASSTLPGQGAMGAPM